tara:strand:+ start:2296 stop:2718 length:423 start_codon:yes stop_codon:yes gene_type:complete
MGGSASDAVERLKPRSVKGVDMQNFGEGMAHNYRQLDSVLGQEEGLGGALGRGMETINQGIAHNVKQVGIIGHGLGKILTGGNPFDQGSKEPGPMTSEANYSQRAGTTGKTSGSKKKADMGDSKTKKSQRGKRALTVRNK